MSRRCSRSSSRSAARAKATTTNSAARLAIRRSEILASRRQRVARQTAAVISPPLRCAAAQQAIDAEPTGAGGEKHDEATGDAEVLVEVNLLSDADRAFKLPKAVGDRRRHDYEKNHEQSGRARGDAKNDREAAEEFHASTKGGERGREGNGFAAETGSETI